PPELLADLRVRDRRLERPLRDPDRLGGEENGRDPPEPGGLCVEPLAARPVQAEPREGARRIDAGARLEREAARVGRDGPGRRPAEDEKAVRDRGVGDEPGAAVRRVVEYRNPTGAAEHLVAGRARERVRREQRPEPRSRRERTPELDEEDHLLGESVACP